MALLRQTLRSNSGQTLLISIALASMLAIALTAIFISNQMGTLHQTANAQRTKGQSVAAEGIAYAAQLLSASTGTWQSALAGSFPSACTSGTILQSASGGRFKLSCSVGTTGNPGLQSYQVAITAVSSVKAPNGSDTSLRGVKAYLSQRTLGADLESGIHAAAAVELAAQPSVTGTLDVHWGPVVCLDVNSSTMTPTSWSLPNNLDSGRYPRKFSVGGITGTGYPRAGSSASPGPNSDQKEYWAFAPQTDVPLVDETYYIQQAQSAIGVTPPKDAAGNTISPVGCTPAGNLTCGYFGPLAGGVTAVFDGSPLPYSVVPGGINSAVIYVDGSAQFIRTAIDGATVIVTGQLSITGAASGSAMPLNVPLKADVEYPYAPVNPTSWSCQDKLGATCSPGNIEFRGFLYVKGNLMVNTPGWAMAGALFVGDLQAPLGTSGTLNIPGPTGPNNASMTVYYDDGVNHNIHVSPNLGTSIKIEPDLLQDVSVP